TFEAIPASYLSYTPLVSSGSYSERAALFHGLRQSVIQGCHAIEIDHYLLVVVERVDSRIIKGQCKVIDRVASPLLNMGIISSVVEQVTNYRLPITDYQLPLSLPELGNALISN
ncbi:MAG: hypothetical protein F6K26_24045, partial [Moorea sp. SIO2I5]|nr:hypothetical protein [Moorena sp. SIO2I5]